MLRSIRQLQPLVTLGCHARLNAIAMSKHKSSYPTHSERPDDQVTPDLPLEVVHDVNNKEFYIVLSTALPVDDNRAYLQYSAISRKLLDLEHTVVPYKYRGQGIAKILAKSAFDFCVQENKDMRLTCTYLQKYYTENPLPEYAARVKS